MKDGNFVSMTDEGRGASLALLSFICPKRFTVIRPEDHLHRNWTENPTGGSRLQFGHALPCNLQKKFSLSEGALWQLQYSTRPLSV
jgi:hypothetical protein